MFLFSCSNDLEKVRDISIQGSESFPIETIENCEIVYSDSAQVRVILNTKLMNRFIGDSSYMEFNEGVRVQFFNSSGSKESELSSLYAIADQEKEIMQARKNVVVRNINGDLLETEHLIWDGQSEEIYTEDFVKITTENEIIYGEGLRSNQDFSKYTIKNVNGTISIAD